MLIEGPLPTVLENEAALTPAERSELTTNFWAGVDAIASEHDIFGFDVYPVPSLPLTLSADYIDWAEQRAPNTERVAVLQGFSYDAESARTDPRRGPTVDESRFIAFDALRAGARHLIWYGASALQLQRPEDRVVWEGVAQTAALVRRWGAVFEGAATPIPVDAGAVAWSYPHADGRLIVVLNRTDGVLELSVPGVRVFDLESGALLPSVDAEASIGMQPWQVRLLWTGC